MGSSSKAKVVPECEGCAKIQPGGTCLAFTEPGWFWTRYGYCPGRVEDPEEWEHAGGDAQVRRGEGRGKGRRAARQLRIQERR